MQPTAQVRRKKKKEQSNPGGPRGGGETPVGRSRAGVCGTVGPSRGGGGKTGEVRGRERQKLEHSARRVAPARGPGQGDHRIGKPTNEVSKWGDIGPA